MIDITNKEEDKDKFILCVALKENSNDYVIKYASDRLEVVPFSIEKLNETLTQMEKQYLEYRDSCAEKSFKEIKRTTVNKLIEALVAVASLYLTCQIEMPRFLQILIIAIIAVISICYQKSQADLAENNENNLRVIATADEFLKHKEEFKIKITDPVSGEEKDWYLLTLSNIEMVYEPKLVGKLAKGLNDEVKEEQSKMTMEVLQKRMKLS